MELNNKLTDKRVQLRKAAQDYQSSLSWYQENLDSPNAEQDFDEASAAFKREIAHREMDIIADLLDELDEVQERCKAEAVPEEMPMPKASMMNPIDAVEAIAEAKGWNACRAAMLKGGAK